MRMMSLIFTLFTFSAHADYMIEWQNEKGGMTKTYYKDGTIRSDTGKTMTITDTKAGFSYVVNHPKKTISKTNLKQTIAQANNFIGDISKTPTKKNKKVNNHDCAISEIKIKSLAGVITSTVCEIHYKTLGISSNTYREMLDTAEKFMPQTKAFFNKDKGLLSIETISSSAFGKQSLTLSRIEEKTLPSSLFKLPNGYQTAKTPGSSGQKMPSPQKMKEAMSKMQEIMKHLTPEQKAQMQKVMEGMKKSKGK